MMIDFYTYNIHEVFVWENIWRSLVHDGIDAAFIIEPPEIHAAFGTMPKKENGYNIQRDQNLVPLVDTDTYTSIVNYLDENNFTYSTKGRYNADAVLTTQGFGWLHRYRSLKMRTMYGVAATRESYGHGSVNKGLDCVFVHGPFSQSKITKWLPPENIILSGFPKYSPYFRSEFDIDAWKTENSIDNERPVIAYIPTWANNSSIDVCIPSLNKLSENYHIICKPHHNNIRFEHERINPLLENAGVTVIKDAASLVPFIAAADLVVTDVRSGAFTEAFLLDRPVVGVMINAVDDDLLPEVFSAASICKDPGTLQEIVEHTVKEDKHHLGRSMVRNLLFSDFNGLDDKITAQKIIEFVESQSIGKKKYPQFNKNNGNGSHASNIDRLDQAELYITQMKYNEAKLLLRSILDDEPNNINALNDIAVVNIQEGNYAGAAECLESILMLDPANEIAKENKQYLRSIEHTNINNNKTGAWKILDEIDSTKSALDLSGNIKELDGVTNIDKPTGKMLYALVKELKPKQSLEIGCAYGISTLYILQSLEDNGYGNHITIDPFEKTRWCGIGLKNIERAGLNHRHRHFERSSQLELPALMESKLKIQFAFIDGKHLFDQTLLEWYYIDKMLEVGGVVVFDDMWMPALQSVVSFIEYNHNYTIIDCPVNRIRVLQKKGDDKRKWDYFKSFIVPNR